MKHEGVMLSPIIPSLPIAAVKTVFSISKKNVQQFVSAVAFFLGGALLFLASIFTLFLQVYFVAFYC